MSIIRTTRVFDRIVANHKNRIQVLQGGTSSSKTYSLLQYLICLAQNSTRSLTISVVSETLPHCKRGVIRDFFKIIGDSYDQSKHNKTENSYRIGRSVIEFFSADQPSKVRGPRRDILFINEANAITEETFTQLEIRTNRKIFLDFNPIGEFWGHELVKRQGVSFDISTYLDNQYLDPSIIKTIEARKFDGSGQLSEWWRVYGEGQIGRNQGVIYSNWDQIDSMPDGTGTLTYGLDFGFTNDPTALLRIVQHNENIWVQQVIYETGLTNQDISDKMEQLNLDKNRTPIYADKAEPKSIEELRRRRWAIKGALKGKDSERVGIDWIKSHKVHVTKESLDVVKELRNYRWQTDKTGKSMNVPCGGWDHAMDALRYGLAYKIRPQEIRTAKWRY